MKQVTATNYYKLNLKMKLLSFIKKYLIFISVFIINTNISFSQFSGGSGIADNPYQIASRADMEALADSVNNGDHWSKDKHFKVTQNITDSIRTIIGFSWNIFGNIPGNISTDTLEKPHSKEYFDGTFDGNNKKITLAISTLNGGSTGLFGILSENAIVQNVEVDGYVKAATSTPITNSAMPAAGGIAAVIFGDRIENCINRCDVHIYLNGDNSGDCGDHTGGIVGLAFYGTIHNCVNFGTIEADFHDAGGIVGSMSEGVSLASPIWDVTISNCVNFGNIYAGKYSSSFSVAGGIAGSLHYSKIINCINIGSVYGRTYDVGGIIGFANMLSIDKCINAGSVIGFDVVGGIAGHTFTANINNSINVGAVSNQYCLMMKNIGAILGHADWYEYQTSITNCHYDKQLCIYNIANGAYGASQSSGHLTRSMLGTALQSVLGTDNWVYSDNLYPMLKYFADNNLCEIARSPVHFYAQNNATYEPHCKLNTNFTMNLENNIKWWNAFDMVSVAGNNGTVNKIGNDTLYAGKQDTFRLTSEKIIVAEAYKTVPIKVIDTFLLTLYAEPEEAGIAAGAGKFINDTLISITATANQCYHFVNWTDSATGEIVSENEYYEFCFPTHNLTLIANFVRDSFDLALKTNPANAGKITGAGRFACGDDTYKIIDVVPNNACFTFINWTDESGNVISENLNDSVVVSHNTLLTANFSNICDVKFVISAKNHDLINPNSTNYKIPIYIQPDKNVPADFFEINRLVIEIDNSVFYPKSVDIAGSANFLQNGITIENITIPALNAGEEIVLFNIIGDILLENTTSSEIIIDTNIELSEILTTKPELKNGHITLNICHEGSDRLVEIVSNSPSLSIKNNPVEDILEVECNVVEKGKYVLEIVDMTGRMVKVKEFMASESGAFLFEIDVRSFGVGRYMLVMVAPSGERWTVGWMKW